ncbi:receptor activity-modifying protein 1 isoform X1 [Crocuta crocuta]
MPSGPSLWWPDRALRLWDLGRQIPAPLSGLTQDPRPARPREEPCPSSVRRSASFLCPGADGLCPPSLGSLRLLLPRREGSGSVPHDRPPFLNGSEAVDSCVRDIRELSHAFAGPHLLPAAHPSHEHPLEPRGKTWSYRALTDCTGHLADQLDCFWPNAAVDKFFVAVHRRYFRNCPVSGRAVRDPPRSVLCPFIVAPILVTLLVTALVVWRSKRPEGIV